MIKVNILEKRYGSTPILGKIALELHTGETLALLGPSGMGKSTLLRLIAQLDQNYEGTIVVPNSIGMMFQEPCLLPWRSSLQNVMIFNPQIDLETARFWISRVGLVNKEALFPGQLSLGQQRRLALARCFAAAPELLLLDEPFVSLDPELAEDMLTLTESLLAETQPTMILVTHAEAEAKRLATVRHVLKKSPYGAVLA